MLNKNSKKNPGGYPSSEQVKHSQKLFKSKDLQTLFVKKGETSLAKIPLKKVVYSCVVLILVSLASALIFQRNLPPEIPLFYGLAEGPEQLSNSLGLVIPSILSLVFLIINASLTFFVENNFLKQTLIIVAFAAALFSTITTFKIIFLVGSL